VLVFACLSLHHFYPSKAAFTLVAFASGMVAGLYVFKSLWVGTSKDWIAGAVIVLTALFTVVLPAAQLLLQSPSLYVGAMVFGALAIGVVREKIPATVESGLDETL
jgi:hypothetical protein